MNNADLSIYLIAALLPLSAAMVVLQRNPFHALIMRGVLGAMAVLTYTVLGAADVALTEALVGTMLAITLYAVAVRSSLLMKLGVLEENAGNSEPIMVSEDEDQGVPGKQPSFQHLVDDLRSVLSKHYLRLELVPFPNQQALQRALIEKEVHAACVPRLVQGVTATESIAEDSLSNKATPPYQTAIRVRRLYEILQDELPPGTTNLISVTVPSDSATAGDSANASVIQLGEENP